MNVETIWTNAHAPRENEYIVEVGGHRPKYRYKETLYGSELGSFRVEHMDGSLVTEVSVIEAIRNHIIKNPGPPKN